LPVEHLDVIVVGAGLSGIGAAWHLQTRCPDRSYAILEGRDAIGGTWDLFRYPGIRSDSDMYTLGYRFRPWRDPKAIADGPAIRAYIEDTARESGIDRRIRFAHRVVRAEWSSDDARWTVHVEAGPNRLPVQFSCGFLYACTGYYDYERGYLPEWPNLAAYRGRLVHPQQWPGDLSYAGKRVVVIGSGATAVTLVPAMATGGGAASQVTMLQRSPSYVASMPTRDNIANALRRFLPERLAYALARWKNVLRGMLFYTLAAAPELCEGPPRPPPGAGGRPVARIPLGGASLRSASQTQYLWAVPTRPSRVRPRVPAPILPGYPVSSRA